MKALILIVLCICFTGIINPVLSNNKAHYAKASEYLEKKGEAYFKFKINKREQLNALTLIISIDKVSGNEVYAYANKQEFDKFLQQNIDYEVLTHPGDLLENPAMYHGLPGEPFEWDKYPTYEAYVAMMEKFQTDYPGLCKLEEFGQSVKERKLLAVKISDNVSQVEAEPEFLYSSTIHGDEVCGYVLMLRLIDYLLSNYGKDPFVTKLVDSIEIWIAPLLNPDGTYNGGNNTISGAVRYNAENFDLDRNFPCPCNRENHKYYGQYASWGKETKAILDFEMKHNFVMSGNIHSGMECAIYPWNALSKNHPDKQWFEYVAKEYADTAQANAPPGYFIDPKPEGFINGFLCWEAHGTLLDSRTNFRHCRTLHLELSTTKVLQPSKLNDYWNYNYKSFLNYMEQVLFGIRGRIKTLITGQYIVAKVFIENHDIDSSLVYSHLPNGDFYRPIYNGIYTIRISEPYCKTATLYKVQINKHEAIKLIIKMYDTMGDAPYCLLAYPNGGEVWEVGKSYQTIWYYKPANFIEVFKGNSVIDSISLPSATFESYLWNIPPNFPSGSDYRIRINKGYMAISDSYFSIIDQSTPIEHKTADTGFFNQQFTVNHTMKTGEIRFTCRLDQKCNVSAEIYSLRGKLIKTFPYGPKNASVFHIDWDGKDNSNNKVPNGCYIVSVKYGDKTLAECFVFSR